MIHLYVLSKNLLFCSAINIKQPLLPHLIYLNLSIYKKRALLGAKVFCCCDPLLLRTIPVNTRLVIFKQATIRLWVYLISMTIHIALIRHDPNIANINVFCAVYVEGPIRFIHLLRPIIFKTNNSNITNYVSLEYLAVK